MIDPERFTFEARRAIDAQGDAIAEMLEPGLDAVPDDGAIRLLTRDGRHVGTIPLYRLLDVDLAMTIEAVKAAAEVLPTHIADQLTAAGRDGRLCIVAPCDDDHVQVTIADDPEAVGLVLHRSTCVPGWPDDDVPEPGDAA